MKITRKELRRLIIKEATDALYSDMHPEPGSKAETDMLTNISPGDVAGGTELGSQAALEKLIERLKLSYDFSNPVAFGIIMAKIGDTLVEMVMNGELDRAIQVFKSEYNKL